MQIFKFIKELLPSFEKRDVLEDLNNALSELKSSTIPVYKSASDELGKYTFKSESLKLFSKTFDRDQKTGIRGNYLSVIHEVAKRIEANGDVINKLTEAVFSGDIVASGITYKKANMLQFIGAISFFQKYARKLLHWTYVSETSFLDVAVENVEGGLTEGDMNWLKENAASFIAVIAPLSLRGGDLAKAIDSIPDIVVVEENADVVARTNGSSIDPLKMNFIPAKFNLIYLYRMHRAEYQNNRYQQALQERKTLEFRLLHLKNKQDGKNDPKVEQLIEYNEARLDKLNYKIKKMEDDV